MTYLKMTRLLLLMVLCVTMLIGCGSQPQSNPADQSSATPLETAATVSGQPVESEVAEQPAATDINLNDTGKTVIKAVSMNTSYPNNSYLIISKDGAEVCVDPSMVVEGIKPDIIASTHSHGDHVDAKLIKDNPDSKVTRWKAESLEAEGIKVTGIASNHNGDKITTNPTNVIYVFEIDGLRIAHMGDIGQTALTDEQLEALGTIDIAFMQFVNSYSSYSLDNEKGFNVIEQLKPQIIIPTHSSPEANQKIGEVVGQYESVDGEIAISKDDLSDGKRKVIEIKNTWVSK